MALPSVSAIPAPLPAALPALPKSWSELTWQQLTDVWACKMRYGGDGDAAQAAALLKTIPQPLPAEGGEWTVERGDIDPVTGEQRYILTAPSLNREGGGWVFTPRELSQLARQALPWFQYPYGDPGKEAVKDEKGKVIEEAVAGVRGYVSGMRDAMILPETELEVDGVLFSLPQMACNNLTWQQYRSLQALAPMLFQEDMSDEAVLQLQAEFLAQILVPARENVNTGDRFAPKHDFTYNAERAEQTVAFWRERLVVTVPGGSPSGASVLFHICFQTYHTALRYYAEAYPLLFSDGGKKDAMKDALQGEVGTINTIMKYAGYAEQQEVYDSNLPFILDILNTMAKEAKEIEQMNARIKRK